MNHDYIRAIVNHSCDIMPTTQFLKLIDKTTCFISPSSISDINFFVSCFEKEYKQKYDSTKNEWINVE